MKKLLSLFICLCVALAITPAALARGETFTLMIYLCGTDLESNGGAATSDLSEMISAGVKRGGNVTVYVQTGGTRNWQAKGLTDGRAERWILSSEGIERVESLGKVNMGAQDAFADFLDYGFDNFPADRYGLIMWDHGSGASGGLCMDELAQDMLYYPELYGALTSASKNKNYKKFAFVGFDACLMATFETAAHMRPFADYMVASEELEPGVGWDYSAWLPSLAADPAISIEKLGRKIVDTFINHALSYDRRDYATLSVTDLSKLDALSKAVEGMGASLSSKLDSDFATISRLRQNMRSFGQVSDYASDMIDLTVFAEAFSRFDEANAKAIKAALKELIVYEKHTTNLSNVTGLSILVPMNTASASASYLSQYNAENLMPQYGGFVKDMIGDLGGSQLSSYDIFGMPGVSQQSIQSAQIDWFSQFAQDEGGYESSAGSLWGDMYGGDYGESNSSDFSLDSFLNTLFSSGECDYNTDYDASGSSLWGDMGDDVDTSFATDSGYGSDSFAGLWSMLGGGAEPTEEPADEPEATAAPSLWGGLQQSAAQGQVQIETAEGQSVTLDNPFGGTQSDYAYTVTLTEEQLDYLGKVEANLMMDLSEPDFECYVELGYVQDVVVDWGRGKIYGMFDGTWATLDGQMVCMYDQIANERYVRSLIPVTVNGDAYYLLVVFDEENPEGVVVGYTEGYTEAGQPARGYTELERGDVVVPQYELIYWDENNEQQSEPFEGDPITVGADGTISFGHEPVEADANYSYGFCLNDIYGDYSYTQFITLSF